MRPSDFGRVIVSWSDVEVEQLHRIVTEEVRRRRLVSAKHDPKGDAAGGRQRRSDALDRLATGQVSAIRAASGAGVKLGTIARQFGLPLATVKRVIRDLTGS
jgi:hypothetical protein